MSREETIPRVSAQLLPPPGMNKRLFIPSETSKFSDIKRRKLNTGIERIKLTKCPKLSTEERKWLQIEAEKEEIKRQRILNMLFYEKTKQSPSVCDESRFDSSSIDGLCQVFNEAMEIEEIRRRPKFKPKVLPQKFKSPSKKSRTNSTSFDLSASRSILSEYNTPKATNKKFTFEKPDSTPRENRFNSPSCISGRRSFDSYENTPKSNSNSISGKAEPCSPTSFQPFNLKTEERGLCKKLSWERQLEIEKFKEEQARLFKASPMPIFTPPEKPQFSHTETVPSPFQLNTEERATQRASMKSQDSNETTGFKARPMPDFSNPFIPETGILEPTQPLDFELNSEIRAQRRSFFNEQLREKERQQLELSKAQELERQAQEEAEIRALRKQQEFKARGIPAYLQLTSSSGEAQTSSAPSLFQIEQRKVFSRMCGDDSICSTHHTDNSIFPSENSMIHDEDMMDFSEL